jgi:hypothetical protein
MLDAIRPIIVSPCMAEKVMVRHESGILNIIIFCHANAKDPMVRHIHDVYKSHTGDLRLDLDKVVGSS